MERRLILDSIENIRDLGGCSTNSGQSTRWRAFVRADHFQTWSSETCQALINYGVKLVVDLRDSQDALQFPNSIAQSPHVTYTNIPFLEDDPAFRQRFRSWVQQITEHHEMYTFMLDECQAQVAKIISTIAIQNAQTTLFHCEAGIGRTGIIAALLLSLVDVPDDIIGADYTLSRDYLAERFAQRRVMAQTTGADMARFEQRHAYPPHTMLKVLDYLRERYGGIPDYLRVCGVSDEHINQLRAMLIDQPEL